MNHYYTAFISLGTGHRDVRWTFPGSIWTCLQLTMCDRKLVSNTWNSLLLRSTIAKCLTHWATIMKETVSRLTEETYTRWGYPNTLLAHNAYSCSLHWLLNWYVLRTPSAWSEGDWSKEVCDLRNGISCMLIYGYDSTVINMLLWRYHNWLSFIYLSRSLLHHIYRLAVYQIEQPLPSKGYVCLNSSCSTILQHTFCALHWVNTIILISLISL